MISPDGRFLNSLDSISHLELEQRRLLALASLGVAEAESIPVFDEAVQTAAHFLKASICLLSFVERDRQCFKATIGLSRIGLMNDLAMSRQLPREESFCNAVIEYQRVMVVKDATTHPDYGDKLLVRRYGIQSYLGVPLFSADGYCIGTLAVLDLEPRQFTNADTTVLELIARWSMSEFDRNRLLQKHQDSMLQDKVDSNGREKVAPYADIPIQMNDASMANMVKANLIAQMVQELRTPLTSILGMASVLNREIYGPLTNKQKEYLDIVHTSSQYMLSLVNETVELGELDAFNRELELTHVDVEMLCQQSLVTLREAAKRREQDINLTMEPGERTWVLDKNKVKQMLYHLTFRVIQASETGSLVRIHVSRKLHQLNLSIWTSHPWLGEGLPHAEVYSDAHTFSESSLDTVFRSPSSGDADSAVSFGRSTDAITAQTAKGLKTAIAETGSARDAEQKARQTRQNLSMLLSRTLVEMHGGSLSIQGSLEAGYRYVLTLPYLEKPDT
ncbi:MAG: GAF domain-containing sensor histidine kinase [Cyanobacteria bacterium P01_F01_bin.150]